MRKINKNEAMPAARTRHGRAVLVGYGLDSDDGHIRITRGQDFQLYGGSDRIHDEMQRRAQQIRREVENLGISLDGMTYEQFQTVKDIVHRVNQEI